MEVEVSEPSSSSSHLRGPSGFLSFQVGLPPSFHFPTSFKIFLPPLSMASSSRKGKGKARVEDRSVDRTRSLSRGSRPVGSVGGSLLGLTVEVSSLTKFVVVRL